MIRASEAWSKCDRPAPSTTTRERTAVVPGTTTLKGIGERENGTSASATVDENYTGTRNPAGGERVAAAGDSVSEKVRTRASGDRAGTGGASDQSSAGSAACTDM